MRVSFAKQTFVVGIAEETLKVRVKVFYHYILVKKGA